MSQFHLKNEPLLGEHNSLLFFIVDGFVGLKSVYGTDEQAKEIQHWVLVGVKTFFLFL